MHAVAGAVAVAGQDALKREKKIASLARLHFRQLQRELQRRAAMPHALDSEGPLGFRPVACRPQDALMPGRRRSMREAGKVGFRTARRGITAPHQSEFHDGRRIASARAECHRAIVAAWRCGGKCMNEGMRQENRREAGCQESKPLQRAGEAGNVGVARRRDIVALPLSEPAPHLLYATSSRIGGPGLDAVALESLRAAERAGIDWQALAFDDRKRAELPQHRIRTLRWHPVRLLSALGSRYYYGAKKHALDRAAARELARAAAALQGSDKERRLLFHGWSGECVRTLRVARRLGVPSIIEIPTWHRHKGKAKPVRLTKSERELSETGGWEGWKNRLLVSRQQMLEEYDLADLLLVLSERAEETFLAAGVPREKLFRHQRGVDVERFTPAEQPPEIFRAVFVGALIKRKGVHNLLLAWRRLRLRNAELVLAGTLHDEIHPYLRDCGDESVKLAGFVARPEEIYRSASVHVFPSSCEGSAKATYEAAACGLPQITTRESGDVVLDGMNGIIIPPDDVDALAAAIERLHGDRDLCARLGAAGRQRVAANFTWEHFRARLREAYAVAAARR
jgi:glycosyltransferase involved in cell wall biosynthesis